MNIKELKVIVTGAAGGLGQEFCRRLAEGGARVAAVDTDARGLASLRVPVEHALGDILTYRCNVAAADEVQETVSAVIAEFGQVNALVNNAGIFKDGLLVRQLNTQTIKMPIPQWKSVIDVDLMGPFLMTREVVAHMVQSNVGKGLVVNISSVSRAGNAGQSNYSAAKAAITVCSVAWAAELAQHGIRVAAIAPGFVKTPALTAMDPKVLERWIATTPVGRVGSPEEIFQGLQFIIECEFFNGKCLEIDGGLKM